MPAPILFSANPQLQIERARVHGNNVTAQLAKLLSCSNQFFVGQRSDK
jgi:hypothetical protein